MRPKRRENTQKSEQSKKPTTMTQGQSEFGNSTISIEDAQNKDNSTLIRREAIDNTPFYLIHQDGKWFVVFGKYRVTEIMEGEATPENALQHLSDNLWLIITRLAGVVHESIAQEAVATMNDNYNKAKK